MRALTFAWRRSASAMMMSVTPFRRSVGKGGFSRTTSVRASLKTYSPTLQSYWFIKNNFPEALTLDCGLFSRNVGGRGTESLVRVSSPHGETQLGLNPGGTLE